MLLGRRRGLGTVVAFACTIVTSGCARSPAPVNSTQPGPFSVVTLGDSVPAGDNCECVPYPELSASELTVPGSREVTAINDAVGGFTSEDVLTQVRSDPGVVSQVTDADVVAVEVGANDVPPVPSCGASIACYQPKIRSVEDNLAGIVARVHQLTHGRRVMVVLLDYWSVWLGGRYAEAQGQPYVDAAAVVTDHVSSVVKQAATNTNSAYVDVRAAFKGPDYADDETDYLAGDGDHPNAAGHRQIADALVKVIRQTLHL